MVRAESTDWFVTLSKPERGGFSDEDEILFLKRIKLYKNYNDVIVVKEKYDRYGNLFPHYHILLWCKTIRRQDKVNSTFQTMHPDSQKNPKEINVRHMKCASTLLHNYLTKQNDVQTIYEDIDEEFKTKLLERMKADEKKQYPLKGMKCPSLMEAPYVIERHIIEKGIEVKTSTDLNYVMKDMIRSREYVMHHLYKKRLEIWRGLAVLLDVNEQDWSCFNYEDQ